MMPTSNPKTTPRNATLDVIATQVNYLVESVDGLKSQMTKFEEQRTKEWIEYKVEHAKIVDRVTEVECDVDQLTKDVDKLEDAISPLVTANKILVWIGGILGASVIIFIWSIITHAVTVGVVGK